MSAVTESQQGRGLVRVREEEGDHQDAHKRTRRVNEDDRVVAIVQDALEATFTSAVKPIGDELSFPYLDFMQDPSSGMIRPVTDRHAIPEANNVIRLTFNKDYVEVDGTISNFVLARIAVLFAETLGHLVEVTAPIQPYFDPEQCAQPLISDYIPSHGELKHGEIKDSAIKEKWGKIKDPKYSFKHLSLAINVVYTKTPKDLEGFERAVTRDYRHYEANQYVALARSDKTVRIGSVMKVDSDKKRMEIQVTEVGLRRLTSKDGSPASLNRQIGHSIRYRL